MMNGDASQRSEGLCARIAECGAVVLCPRAEGFATFHPPCLEVAAAAASRSLPRRPIAVPESRPKTGSEGRQ